jgi:3-oxoacyl-[acyl-carrier-protein] synthase II
MTRQNRVVITGVGVLAATGVGVDSFWKALLAGRSGVRAISLFDAGDLACRIAGEVPAFDPCAHIDSAFKPCRWGRTSQLAAVAAGEALKSAGLSNGNLPTRERIPVYLGVSTSDTGIIEKQVLRIAQRGGRAASPMTAISSLPQAAAGAIVRSLGLNANAITFSTGCPAGLDAIGHAMDQIQDGHADVALAGGADAPITLLTVATFCAGGGVSCNNEHPEEASRPYDLRRDGGIIAEGASVVVLENHAHAMARGARILAEIVSYGAATDSDTTLPGGGLEWSMRLALTNAGMLPSDVDYVCGHGPSDPLLDAVEVDMVKRSLGRHAYKVALSSIKGAIGNPLAAAGGCQLVASALSLSEGIVPPIANHRVPDPRCDLDCVAGSPRLAHPRVVLINNHGFGGSNSTLVVRRWEGP